MASRFLTAAVDSRTIAGTTSVGGTTDTVISLRVDGTIRFVDRNGKTRVVPVPVGYVTGFKNRIQPSAIDDSPAGALFALVDVLLARE